MGRNAAYRVPMPGSQPGDEGPGIDWRFAGLLNSASRAFDARCEAAKQPGGFRDDYGIRHFWRDTLPSLEEREAVKAKLPRKMTKSFLQKNGFNSWCPCCNRHFAMPSAFVSIREHGLCSGCQLFAEGKFDGVIAERPPTLDEALAVKRGDLRPAEAELIRQAYLALRSP